MAEKLYTMKDAEQYLFNHIPHAADIRFSGADFLARSQRLCALLGNPQEQVQVIHVAGTSGKGSTVFLTAAFLQASGASVGAFFSPHLVSVRERIMLGGQPLSAQKFVKYLNAVRQATESLQDDLEGPSTYFEILAALAYYTFAQEGVDYAVMETGMGGLYDATNVVQAASKIAVITDIGMDHMKVLGTSLPEIAAQKAGIIQQGNAVFSFIGDDAARAVIQKAATEKEASFVQHLSGSIVSDVTVSPAGTTFTLCTPRHASTDVTERQVSIGLIGAHQARNAALALSVVDYVTQCDGIQCDGAGLDTSLADLRFPGRCDVRTVAGRTVIHDGAHNPQKMVAFVETLKVLYPGQKFQLLFAAKAGKDYTTMLRMLLPHVSHITLTQFGGTEQDYLASSVSVTTLQDVLDAEGFTHYECIEDVQEAFEHAVHVGSTEPLVVTGSLCLVGKILLTDDSQRTTNDGKPLHF